MANLPAEVILELVEHLEIKDFYGLRATHKDLFLMLQNDIFAQASFKVSIACKRHRRYTNEHPKAQCQTRHESQKRYDRRCCILEVSQ